MSREVSTGIGMGMSSMEISPISWSGLMSFAYSWTVLRFVPTWYVPCSSAFVSFAIFSATCCDDWRLVH